MPKGFPAPGAVGEVVEKQYPPLRSYSATGPGAFGDCFGYLSRHKHEMTAPVVMDAASTQDGKPRGLFGSPIAVDRMHFLLETPSLDEPKTEGSVTVADMPGLRVLSIAHQGAMSPETVKEAEAKLSEAIAARPELEAAGPIRVLGYNSPFVARAKQYWEIQKPIKDKAR
ncbi:heme-binding protein [Tundrisphaera sp. TA3]|uniref:heme-binding protein n=1 Tax=Tundrisphaera sp. TA3 TaxID=3435775 RepID=UPI003EB9E4CA